MKKEEAGDHDLLSQVTISGPGEKSLPRNEEPNQGIREFVDSIERGEQDLGSKNLGEVAATSLEASTRL